jgi:hypothetical protein
MSASNIISHAERTRSLGDDESLSEVLDFLVTEEQLGVTLVSAAIENAPGTPSEAFLPVLRNGVTQEYLHVEALKEAGGKPGARRAHTRQETGPMPARFKGAHMKRLCV